MDARNTMNFPCVVFIRSLHPDYMTLGLRAEGLILCVQQVRVRFELLQKFILFRRVIYSF